jgi:hypothetical protein
MWRPGRNRASPGAPARPTKSFSFLLFVLSESEGVTTGANSRRGGGGDDGGGAVGGAGCGAWRQGHRRHASGDSDAHGQC